jgi:hypothetical protein
MPNRAAACVICEESVRGGEEFLDADSGLI